MRNQVKKITTETKTDNADVNLKFEKVLLILKEILAELQALRNRFV